jgi:hypothetical protein
VDQVVVVKLVARVTRHLLAHLREMQVAIALLVAIMDEAVVVDHLLLDLLVLPQTAVTVARALHQQFPDHL